MAHKTFGFALFYVALLGTSPAAVAASVFLNGVNIDGVTGQRFENCTVVIDQNGDVQIAADGYRVETAVPTSAAPATAGGPVTQRYFLVSETNAPGMAQYDIDIFVNATWVKRISHEDPQTVIELSRYLKQGKNLIHFTATKVLGSARRSTSPQHYMRVIIGEGSMGGNNVMIENALVEYTRTAADMKNFSDEFTIKGR